MIISAVAKVTQIISIVTYIKADKYCIYLRYSLKSPKVRNSINQGLYIQQSTEKSIKESIADLHLERFATKADLSAVEYRLDAKIDKVEHRLEVKMEQLERRLEEKINKVAYDLEKFKIYIEKNIGHKFFKHTTINANSG